MKAKNYHFMHGGAVLLLSFLAACQHDELPSTPPAGDATVITFNSPYTVDTRSAAMRYGSFQKGDKVGVLGFCKAENNGTDYSTSDWNTKKPFCRPDVFYNQELTYDGAGWWDYSWDGTFDGSGPVGDYLHPWSSDPDDTFAFFAYYPYAANGNLTGKDETGSFSMGTIDLSDADHRGDPTIKYTMPFATGGTITSNRRWWHVPDFMLAYKVNHRKADGSVQLDFRHLFCAFEFEVNNYNDDDVIIEDFYFGGGTEDSNGDNIAGFYRSCTVTGQQSGYDVDPTDMYVGQFQLVGATGNEPQHILRSFTCRAGEEGVSIDYNGSPISILLIPGEDGSLTTDKNASLYIRLQARTATGTPIGDGDDRLMNLVDLTFEPGVRNIFTINIIGNDFYVQMRSDGRWEDDGDSDIVFE